MKLSTTSVTALSAADSPEEAAKIFYDAVSRSLAVAMAEAVEEALNSVKSAATKPAIAGWEKLIGGCGLHIMWQSPSVMKPLPLMQVACFAPYPASMPVHAAGVGVSVGISITGSF